MITAISTRVLDDGFLRRWGSLLVLALLAAVWLSFPKRPGVFPLDDAYIHLSYVRNLAESGTFGLNPNEFSTGTSAPLWVAMLTPFHWLGADAYWTAVIISLALFLLLAYPAMTLTRLVAAGLGFPPRETVLASLAAGTLVALNGMETMLFLSLGFLGILLYVRRSFGSQSPSFNAHLHLASPTCAHRVVILVLRGIQPG